MLQVISGSPRDLAPVFDTILENATRLCEAELGMLYRYDGMAIEAVAMRGLPADLQDEYRAPRPVTPASGVARALVEKRPIHLPDIVEDEAYRLDDPLRRRAVEALQARTMLWVPLLKEETAIGVLAICRRDVRPFTDKQIALVGTFADQAVIAIENVRLFQELQARVEELRTLGEVSQAVGSSLNLQRVLEAVAGHAVTLSGADAGGIFELLPERQTFEVVAASGLGTEFIDALRTTRLDSRGGTIGQATETGQPAQIADVEAATAYPLRSLLLAQGFRAVLALPMGDAYVARGMVLMRRAPGEFDERVVALLTAIANQSKVAIDNARLFREAEEKGQQLEVANRHKSEFLANMSHELRTPLNAVIGFSEVLLDRMFGDVNAKQEEYLQDILSSGRHLLSLINDILDLSKVEAGRMDLDLAPFDMPSALDNALTLVRERAARHGIALVQTVEEGVGEVTADERKVKQILLNLLSNAVKFTPEGGRVSVRAALANGSVEISVTDTGIGIAPEDHEAIFEEFRQVGTDYARKREGTGLGLPLARRFVELHGGALWVKSAPGEGSTFTFSLPVQPPGAVLAPEP